MIETDRLLLRPIEKDDIARFVAIYADPEVMRHIGSGGPATPEETTELIGRRMAEYASRGYGILAVVEKASGELIGRCGLLHWQIEGTDELEVGYILARSAWGRGYATEAASAVRDFALHELGRRRLIALVRYGNDASANVARKLGMNHERDVDLDGDVARLYALSSSVEP